MNHEVGGQMDETEHESQPKEPTITFDNGVTLTLSQYDEYIEQQQPG